MAVNAPTVRTWPKPGEVYYPESDGKPMAENAEQFNWIVLLVENIKTLFATRPGTRARQPSCGQTAPPRN
jgi:hypothetical protein